MLFSTIHRCRSLKNRIIDIRALLLGRLKNPDFGLPSIYSIITLTGMSVPVFSCGYVNPKFLARFQKSRRGILRILSSICVCKGPEYTISRYLDYSIISHSLRSWYLRYTIFSVASLLYDSFGIISGYKRLRIFFERSMSKLKNF